MYLLLKTAFTTLRIHLGKKVRESGGTVVVMALNLEKGRWCISLLGLPNKYHRLGGFPDGASSKEPACQCRRHSDMGFIPGLGDPLEEETTTHSNIFAWRIPWTKTGRLSSTGLKTVKHDWSDLPPMGSLKNKTFIPSQVLKAGNPRWRCSRVYSIYSPLSLAWGRTFSLFSPHMAFYVFRSLLISTYPVILN